MSINVAAHRSDHFGAGASPTSGTLTTQATGSTIVVFVGWYDSGADITSVTDNKGNGNYTQIQSSIQYAGDTNFRAAMFYKQNAAGGSGHTVTANFDESADLAAIFFIEVTGGLTSGILDQNPAGNTDTTDPYTSNTTGTTAQANELALTCAQTYTTTAGPETLNWSANSYTALDAETDPANWTGGSAKKVLSATGTQQSSVSSSGAGAAAALMFIATFKAAAEPPATSLFFGSGSTG